ncbi:hypothetical protein OHA40_05450 [Nocardia sp. NBC_00508]|uniref:hypothetical protein n=1 Tax=Nocardia sp. NBC_00508 TaxID=2975992 RepID=UPI002E803B94|nr:hypothetical protein [Nocardia sp. NBC_00508]WUD67583.1 hypothetical protein OHA40_05450 [Nocardia sp. NBC_00508]
MLAGRSPPDRRRGHALNYPGDGRLSGTHGSNVRPATDMSSHVVTLHAGHEQTQAAEYG